jgi:hypothetical protein
MLKNTQKIAKVKFSKIAHCFCPLGNDWYTCNVDAEVYLGEELIDFLDIDAYFRDEIESKSLIVEDVVAKTAEFIDRYNVNDYSISAKTSDAVHCPVEVIKHKFFY